MKHFTPTVTTDAADLRRAFGFARSVVERRSTIPVLQTCRFDVQADRIVITGTDLDVESTSWCPAEVSVPPFSFTLPPATLTHILHWATGPVSLTMDDDVLRIRADDFSAAFRALIPAEDFPEFAWSRPDDAPYTAALSEAKLRKALGLVRPTISTEETRYYLNGVFFTPQPDRGLRMVTTDGHSLTTFDTRETWAGDACILPRITVDLLCRHLSAKGNRAVTLRQHATRMEIATEDWRLRTKLIDGTFPDYTRVIPPEADVIDVTITAAALDRFPPTGDRSRAIRIDPDAGIMAYSIPHELDFSMPVTGRGPAFGVNLGYLQGFARQYGTVQLRSAGRDSPFRVLTEDPDLLQVLMPMRV